MHPCGSVKAHAYIGAHAYIEAHAYIVAHEYIGYLEAKNQKKAHWRCWNHITRRCWPRGSVAPVTLSARVSQGQVYQGPAVALTLAAVEACSTHGSHQGGP